MDKGRILAVDDTPSSLRLLTELLEAEGYEVRAAISGELALNSAGSSPPELVLLDVNMPGMDGYEVCRRIREQERNRDVPVIFVSALSDTDGKLKGFELGAVDYITKPYQREELLARVRTHLELYRLRHHLEETAEERAAELRKSQQRLKSSLIDSVTAIAATVELRDPYTAGHQRRVALIACAIGREIGLSEKRIEGMNLAAVVHDIGKVKIPAEILTKPGRLNELEYALIRQHPGDGHDILKGIDFPWPIATFVLQHHERMNGSGYSSGLSGEEIHFESRIISVADVIEAMASHRPYRPGHGIEAALSEIESHSGTLYDPEISEVALRLFREKGYRIEP